MSMKEKGQPVQIAKSKRLAFTLYPGGLAERLNATDCKSVNGAIPTVQGFKSLTRRWNEPYSRGRTNPQIQYPAFGCGTQEEISQ